MYFFLSKFLLFLLMPIYWIMILLLIAAFTGRKKLRKRTSIAAVILVLIFSNGWLCNWFCHSWEWKEVSLPANAHYSCAIVLGGFSSQINAADGRFNSVADRFIQGMRLEETGKVSHILISGGNGTLNPGQYTEADWAKRQLEQFHVADTAIIAENRSRNTLENAKFSAALLKQRGLKPPYLLVTSGFHMRRAIMIFKNAGVEVAPYPCNFITGDVWRFTFSDIVPNFETITNWDLIIKEEFGYVVNYFMK
jgi:uncharacterized SAM-binding protein YcdF (DUF218 family)